MTENEQKKNKAKKERPRLPKEPPICSLLVALGEEVELTTDETMKKEKAKKQNNSCKVRLTVSSDKEKNN